jgi:hypothetical protein
MGCFLFSAALHKDVVIQWKVSTHSNLKGCIWEIWTGMAVSKVLGDHGKRPKW